MIEVIWGASDAVAKWVSDQIGGPDFGPCQAAGVMVDGNAAAGIVFHNYFKAPNGRPIGLEISCASIDKRWANRHTLRELFKYPFITCGVERVMVSIPLKSKGVIKFNEKLGFTWEGTGRRAHFSGDDLYVMSMLKDECLWIKEEISHGKIDTIAARSARSGSSRGGQSANGALERITC